MKTIYEKLKNTFPVNDFTREKLGRLIHEEILKDKSLDFVDNLNKKNFDTELLAVALHFNVPNFDSILNAYESEHGEIKMKV